MVVCVGIHLSVVTVNNSNHWYSNIHYPTVKVEQEQRDPEMNNKKRLFLTDNLKVIHSFKKMNKGT